METKEMNIANTAHQPINLTNLLSSTYPTPPFISRSSWANMDILNDIYKFECPEINFGLELRTKTIPKA